METETMNIDDMDVSEKWKSRFRFYYELMAGHLGRDEFIKTEKFKSLKIRDKLRFTSGNLWAFLGGVFIISSKVCRLKEAFFYLFRWYGLAYCL